MGGRKEGREKGREGERKGGERNEGRRDGRKEGRKEGEGKEEAGEVLISSCRMRERIIFLNYLIFAKILLCPLTGHRITEVIIKKLTSG